MVFAQVKNSNKPNAEANPMVATLEKECAGLLKFLRVVETYAQNPASLLNANDIASVHRNADELKQIQFKAEREVQGQEGTLSSETLAQLQRPKEMVYDYIARFNSLHSSTRPELVPGQRLILLNALASGIKDAMPRQREEIFNEINRSMGARLDA